MRTTLRNWYFFFEKISNILRNWFLENKDHPKTLRIFENKDHPNGKPRFEIFLVLLLPTFTKYEEEKSLVVGVEK